MESNAKQQEKLALQASLFFDNCTYNFQCNVENALYSDLLVMMQQFTFYVFSISLYCLRKHAMVSNFLYNNFLFQTVHSFFGHY